DPAIRVQLTTQDLPHLPPEFGYPRVFIFYWSLPYHFHDFVLPLIDAEAGLHAPVEARGNGRHHAVFQALEGGLEGASQPAAGLVLFPRLTDLTQRAKEGCEHGNYLRGKALVVKRPPLAVEQAAQRPSAAYHRCLPERTKRAKFFSQTSRQGRRGGGAAD